MTENKTEILPCPFCGNGKPYIDTKLKMRCGWQAVVYCENTLCNAKQAGCTGVETIDGKKMAIDEAVKNWNTRATVTPSELNANLIKTGGNLTPSDKAAVLEAVNLVENGFKCAACGGTGKRELDGKDVNCWHCHGGTKHNYKKDFETIRAALQQQDNGDLIADLEKEAQKCKDELSYPYEEGEREILAQMNIVMNIVAKHKKVQND